MYLQFTPLGLEDITLIQHLGRASYEPYYRHIWHPGGIDWYMDLCFNEASLRKELSDPNVTYLLPQTENGEIIGLLKLLLLKPAPNHLEDNALYLEKIYLMPAFYGKGMGQLLMQYVFETAQSLNRAAVWLMVLKNGPVAAYLKAGFEIAGKTRWDFELLKPEERDGLVMLKPVN